MVRAIGKESKIVGTGLMIVKLACDSDDTKPVNGVATGSTCLEVDTGDLYIFSEDDKTWNFLKNVGGEGGGGGGDSDLSTAEVTIKSSGTFDPDASPFVNIVMPSIFESPFGDEVSRGSIGYEYGSGEKVYNAILYKNTANIDFPVLNNIEIRVNGNIEETPPLGYNITGDCVIEFVGSYESET